MSRTYAEAVAIARRHTSTPAATDRAADFRARTERLGVSTLVVADEDGRAVRRDRSEG